ncbi:MAG: hypothetical protein HY289_07560 [Planctomycetes bacterium]|nr:hypothetical protein [Planctomycetota bacterium]
METVQLQCGHCKQVMAISVEHLGGQVQCPHCKGVVQTAARTPPPAVEPVAPAVPNLELHQRESIFAGPEASDAVLGETAPPQVELPPAPISDEQPSSATHFTPIRPRPVYDRGVFAMYGLIFLVPYALLTTLAIIYLVFFQPPRPHPLDVMPDPVPEGKKGGAKPAMQTHHAQPLAEHQKTTLTHTIRVGKDGDLMVTPERLRWTSDGDLQLFLRAKNISTNASFAPINDAFLLYDAQKKGPKPYSYLESGSGKVDKLFSPFLEYRKNVKDDKEPGIDVLGRDQETIIVLTTNSADRKPHVEAIAKSNDSYTWRVQLRRGFVKWKGKDISTTAVIGIDFTTAQIERGS